MKILLIRTAPLPICDWAVQKLAGDFPGCEIHVLTRAESAGYFEQSPDVRKTIPYSYGFFDFEQARATVLPQLKKEKYDRVAFIYNTPGRAGFFHVRAMAEWLRPAVIMAFALDRSVTEEPGRGFRPEVIGGLIMKNLVLVPLLSALAAGLGAVAVFKRGKMETHK